MVVIILNISETEASNLSHTLCSGDILRSQADRFETETNRVRLAATRTSIDNGEDPTLRDILSRNEPGTMHWCNSWVEAKLLQAYAETQGYDSHIMWDLSDGYGHCIWTSEPVATSSGFGPEPTDNRNPVDYTAPFEEE